MDLIADYKFEAQIEATEDLLAFDSEYIYPHNLEMQWQEDSGNTIAATT
jgi:hypothetical protein